jgi:hypothetical protein
MAEARYPSLTDQIEQMKGVLDKLPGQLADARRTLSIRRKDAEVESRNTAPRLSAP